MGWADDTFWHLSPLARAGLAGVAIFGGGVWAALCLWVFRRVAPRPGAVGALVFAALALWGWEWLSPQLFYAYFRLVIDGLPAQVVVGWPPAPGHFLRLALFAEAGTIRGAASGLFFWGLVAAALALRRPRSRRSR